MKISPLHCPAKPPHCGMKQRGGPQGPPILPHLHLLMLGIQERPKL